MYEFSRGSNLPRFAGVLTIRYHFGKQEQKAAAASKAQIEKLQHEKDEFQRMVISTQVSSQVLTLLV